MPTTPIFQVDAFTDRPFAGNPAAVCPLAGPAEPAWMQAVAAEMNLSETAFLHRQGDGFALRWFTPLIEVDLCGHATLAAAHVLWTTGWLPPEEPVRFDTLSGRLTASRAGDWIWLNFPTEPAAAVPPPPGLIEALGVPVVWIGRNRMDYVVELESAAAVRALRPDLDRLATIDTRGIIVTAAAEHTTPDFVARFFAPGVGIPEDPVTGSAYCCLGPFWGERLGRTNLTATQLSARGGVVRVELRGARIQLGGQAVTVLRGDLQV